MSVDAGTSKGIFANEKITNINYKWTIYNFNRFTGKGREKIYSPEFPEEKTDCMWQLKLYPFGRSKMGSIAVFLGCMTTSEFETKAKFRLSLLHESKIRHQTEWTEVQKFFNKHRWGYEKFIERQQLGSADTITIFCEIKVYDGKEILCEQNLIQLENHNMMIDLSKDMYNLLETGLYSDAKLIFKEKIVSVHRSLLSIRSTYFNNAFKKCKKNKNNIYTIEINDFCYEVIMEVLRYIYCGKIENLQLNALNYLVAAQKYNLPSLKIMCEKYLKQKLSEQSPPSTLLLRSDHNVMPSSEKTLGSENNIMPNPERTSSFSSEHNFTPSSERTLPYDSEHNFITSPERTLPFISEHNVMSNSEKTLLSSEHNVMLSPKRMSTFSSEHNFMSSSERSLSFSSEHNFMSSSEKSLSFSSEHNFMSSSERSSSFSSDVELSSSSSQLSLSSSCKFTSSSSDLSSLNSSSSTSLLSRSESESTEE